MAGKSKKWTNVILLYFKVLIGKEMKKTSYNRTYDSSNKRITLSFAPGDEYYINAQDIAIAKEANSNYLFIMSPYTPVTHEELVGFEVSDLIDYFKNGGKYSKKKIGGETFLKISYDNVCDLALFMRTLR